VLAETPAANRKPASLQGVFMPNGITTPRFNFSTFRRAIIDGTVLNRKATVFLQGDPGDAVFYIQKGKVKMTAVSKRGREATVGVSAIGQ
jgi:CRP-like cAMP-binding protein